MGLLGTRFLPWTNKVSTYRKALLKTARTHLGCNEKISHFYIVCLWCFVNWISTFCDWIQNCKVIFICGWAAVPAALCRSKTLPFSLWLSEHALELPNNPQIFHLMVYYEHHLESILNGIWNHSIRKLRQAFGNPLITLLKKTKGRKKNFPLPTLGCPLSTFSNKMILFIKNLNLPPTAVVDEPIVVISRRVCELDDGHALAGSHTQLLLPPRAVPHCRYEQGGCRVLLGKEVAAHNEVCRAIRSLRGSNEKHPINFYVTYENFTHQNISHAN